jgi:hypothetical protein
MLNVCVSGIVNVPKKLGRQFGVSVQVFAEIEVALAHH